MIEWSDVDIAVRDAVREFVDKEIRPHVDALESGEMEPYPIIRKLFATFGIAEMSRDSLNKRLARLREGGESSGKQSSGGGMFGEGSGGMGFVVVSELCRVSMGIVTGMGVSLGLTVPTIMGRGTLAQQERWLPDLVTYDKIGAWAITEPDSGSDAFGGMKSYVVRDGDDYILNGQKTFITNGPDADVVVVYAKLKKTKGRRRRQARPQGPHVRPRPGYGGLRPVKALPQDGYSQLAHRRTVLQQRPARPRQTARRNRGHSTQAMAAPARGRISPPNGSGSRRCRWVSSRNAFGYVSTTPRTARSGVRKSGNSSSFSSSWRTWKSPE